MGKEVVVCIIKNNKKELLFQKKTMDYALYPGLWSLFGGNIKSGNLDKEMERELREEIGIKLKPKFIFRKKITTKKENIIVSVFLAELNDISKIKIGEGAGFAFFDRKELKKLNLTPEAKLILKEYFKK